MNLTTAAVGAPVVVEIKGVAAADLAPSVEAVLLSTDKPVSAARLAAVLPPATEAGIREAVRALNEQYGQTGRAFRIETVAGGFRLMTLPKFGAVLEAFHGEREKAILSRAALETLAIIAYKQPLTRASLEAIRGVACGDLLRSLIDRHLVTVVGRAEDLGRPLLYGTTKRFLETFGLANLKDLPTVEELRPRAAAGEGN